MAGKNTNACRLTDETHGALYQTTQALVEITRYCFDELHLSFVLLGKFQTDLPEDRFGKYRRLAGSHYHVSIRQLYESENKLRLQSTLPLVSTSTANHTDEDQNWEAFQERASTHQADWNVVVTAPAISKLKDVLPVVAYIAGYAVHVTLKKVKCDSYKDALIENRTIIVSSALPLYSLVKEINRGGLVYPAMSAVNAVAHNYVVVEQIATKPEFLKAHG